MVSKPAGVPPSPSRFLWVIPVRPKIHGKDIGPRRSCPRSGPEMRGDGRTENGRAMGCDSSLPYALSFLHIAKQNKTTHNAGHKAHSYGCGILINFLPHSIAKKP